MEIETLLHWLDRYEINVAELKLDLDYDELIAYLMEKGFDYDESCAIYEYFSY